MIKKLFESNRIQKLNQHKVLYSILLNLPVLIAFLLFADINYETNDTLIYSVFITNGYYKFYFINYLLCVFIGFVQNIIYPVNAYTVISLIMAFLSFCGITFVLTEKFGTKSGTAMMLFLYSAFAVDFYSTISFSLTPALLCTAGYLLIIHCTGRKKRAAGTVLGAVLLIFSVMYRFKVFLVGTLAAAVFVFACEIHMYLLADKQTRTIKDLLKKLFEPKRIAALALSVVLGCSFQLVSSYFQTSTPELEYFLEYTTARSQVEDYPIPDYGVNFDVKDDYDRINIDANDLKVLTDYWILDDEGAFPLNKLKEINEIKINYNNSKTPIQKIRQNIISPLLKEIKALGNNHKTLLVAIFLFVTMFAFFIMRKQKGYIIPAFILITVTVLYVYLCLAGRTPYRSIFGFFLPSVVFLLYSIDAKVLSRMLQKIKTDKSHILKSLLIIAFCFFTVAAFLLSYGLSVKMSQGEAAADLIKYMDENKDSRFEFLPVGGDALTLYENNVWKVRKTDKNSNYISFACTFYKHPYNLDKAKYFGADNLFSNLLNDNVYFVCYEKNDRTIMEKYLEKYYSGGEDVVCKPIKRIDNYNVFKFSIE